MAKFAQVTYGTQGNTEEYTYVVNDNVRTGDYLQPAVKHYKSGKIYGTTGIVQSTAKETSATGQEIRTDLDSKGVDAAEARTQADTGVERFTDRDAETGRLKSTSGLKKTVKDANTGIRKSPLESGTMNSKAASVQFTRAANVELRASQESGKAETFESYSRKFMESE